MIKLEFGKKYRNRQGDVVIVMSLDELNKRRKEAGKSQLAPNASESDYFGVFPGLSFTAHRKDGINFYGNTNYDLVEEVNELNLELGKEYKSKSGEVWKVVTLEELNKLFKRAYPSAHQIKADVTHPRGYGKVFLAWCEKTAGWNPYRSDGTIYDGPSKFGHDLVEEIPGLNFEIGKYYKTANCVKVKILETDIPNDKDMMYVMFMSTGSTAKYNKNGEYVSNKNYNIIGEWKEVKKVKGWIAVIHDRYTGKTFAGDIIYDTKELALAAPNAVGASEIEVEYEVK